MTKTQQAAREERQAMCEVEKVPQAQIDAIFRDYPEIYGIADYSEKQERLL